jgi:CheY-like chemotaxis protein
LPLVCQLHGGDIGVSSKEGEGSTFGFFFRVRRSDGQSENGRPPFQSRSNSESSQTCNRESTPQARPGYSRANSNLTQIKERNNERPAAKTLTSHHGVDIDQGNVDPGDGSLQDPPTEHLPESHPATSIDESRYKETEKVAKDAQTESSTTNKLAKDNLPKLQEGETKRQVRDAERISKSQSNQPSAGKETLLLVEDNLINQKVLRRQLQARGFEVFIANNGQEAIDAVSKRGQIANDNPNNRNFFDIILMDQEMPVKDGNAATQEIRQLQQEGKAGYSHIIGVSANVREAQTDSMREAGMDDVISKPFKVDDLVKRIRSIMLEDAPSYDSYQKKDQPVTNSHADNEIAMLDAPRMRKKGEHKNPETGGSANIALGDDARASMETTPEKNGKEQGKENSR